MILGARPGRKKTRAVDRPLAYMFVVLVFCMRPVYSI